jgi:hypothetical protein
MTVRELPTPKINLNVPPGTPPLTMEMQKFFDFSFWMAEELLDLEAQFSNWQTPASRKPPTKATQYP